MSMFALIGRCAQFTHTSRCGVGITSTCIGVAIARVRRDGVAGMSEANALTGVLAARRAVVARAGARRVRGAEERVAEVVGIIPL